MNRLKLLWSLSNLECFDDLMAVTIRKLLFSEFDSGLAENILNLFSDFTFFWTETDFLPDLTVLISLCAGGSEVGLVAEAFTLGSVLIQQEKMFASFLLSKGMVYPGFMAFQ
jgi:hypothetical protein